MKIPVSKIFVISAGSFSLLLGLVVIVGWFFHVSLLIQVLPGFVPMQFNTALGFFLSGSALLFYVYKKNTYILVIMTIIGFIGFLTLIEYLFDINLGIDELLMRHYIDVETSHPGRMAPNTALCFLLFGLSAVSYRLQQYRSTILGILGLLIISLAVTALMGYVGGISTAYGWGQLTRMAVHTSIGFCFLGSGLCFLSFLEKKSVGIPDWIPYAVVITMLTISVLLWQAVKAHNNLSINELMKLEALLQQKIVNRYIDERFNALERMAERWVASGGTAQEVWERDARRYIEDQPIYQAIEWVDPKYQVQWVIPQEGNEAAIGLNLKFEGKRLAALEKAVESRMFAVSQAIDFVQGGKGFLIFFPLFIEDKFDGFILGVFTFQKFFTAAFNLESRSKDISMAIHEGETELLTVGEKSEQGKQYNQKFDINISDVPWQVNIQPSEQFLAIHKSNFATIILLAGMIIALLSGVILKVLIARNKDQQRLIEVESLSSAILHTVVDAIISIDTKGRIILFNPAAEKIFGYSENEVHGKNIKMLMPSPFYEEHDGYLENYLKTGKKKIIGVGREVIGKRKDGSTFPMELAVSEIIVEGGHSFTGVVRDITQHKNAMSEIQKRQDKLQRSNEELERFAYIASHDLQEPLRMVSSYTQLLAKRYKDKLDQDAHDYINFAVDGAIRMQALIQDLLKYSRLNTEAKVFDKVNANDLFDYAMQNLEVTIDETGTVVTKDTLPMVLGDERQLRQLFQNLISNAVKYRDPEKLNKVHISAEEIENGWQFCVEDNGIGIAPEYYEKIFVIFKRLHTLSEYKGTGIGLSLCKRIVESHNGRIWVESIPGQGSRFYFTLEPT